MLKLEKKTIVLILLMVLNPISGIGIDMNAPSLPFIVAGLHTHISLAQLTMSIYVLGFGLGQIAIGNLSDSFGRRHILLLGLLGFIISSVFAANSPSISFLLIMRFLQGIFVAAPGNLSKTIATDYYTKEEMTKVSSWILGAWGLGPIIAPAIGAYLQHHFNWQAIFYCLGAYGLFAFLLTAFFMPETNKHKTAFNIHRIKEKHREVFSSKIFIASAFSMAIGYSLIVVFNTVAPFLIQNLLHYSVIFYGHLALGLGFAFCLGSFSNLIFVKYFSERLILLSAIILMCLFAFLMFLVALFNFINLLVIIVPIFIIFYAMGYAYPYYMGKCISLFPKIAGAASSTSGCIVMIGTATVAAISSIFKTHSQLPLAMIYLALVVLLAWIYLSTLKYSFSGSSCSTFDKASVDKPQG